LIERMIHGGRTYLKIRITQDLQLEIHPGI